MDSIKLMISNTIAIITMILKKFRVLSIETSLFSISSSFVAGRFIVTVCVLGLE